MKLQFNAFIPGFLGMPLEMVVAFNNRIALENRDAFYKNVERAGRFKTWITEPFSTNTFCSTDTRNFGEHNIALKTMGTSRLYLVTPETLMNGINLASIGKMKQKYHGQIFKKFCSPSHRVAVNFGYDYGGINATQSNSPNLYRINPNLGCHYGHYRAPMYGTVYEFPAQTSNPEESSFNYQDMIFDLHKDHSCIKTGAQAGYPFAEPLSPNIDFDLVINMYRMPNGYKVEIAGKHNNFPYYEMLINGELAYQYNAVDFGPGMINLNTQRHFYYTKYLSK